MKNKNTIIKSSVFGLLLCGLLMYFFISNKSANYSDITILNSNCPPGFMLNENNECVSKNFYQQYDSPNNKGVGGLQTGLPKVRDGFTPQEIDLGRYLFFDPVLSGDGTMSCATCHVPDKGFSDGLATSIGKNNKKLDRGAPTLWNVGYLNRLFWDGRATSLEEQLEGPLFSEVEMANTPENLLSTLNNIDNYRQLFAEAYPERGKKEAIKLNEVFTALAAFQSSLVSLNSRYDRYAHGFHEALNSKEIEGMNVFRSFVARCAECHTPPLFTNQQLAVIGTPEPDGLPLDPGAEIPFNDKTLRGAFKVPSLRNIEKTAPYMHSGKFATLREAVQFYTDGRGHAVPDNENLIIHWHIWEPQLSDYEMDRLVDFLKTLTDESFTPKIPEKLPSGLKVSI
ncbi:cytochrome-c peroxidase [Hwangdonia lutea]|uniref:Methylamine utilization protein MauG n=1 Tax=Hwangdonia lutea TaxID=3075823 RepID=A0AA97HRH9_9FLAO|nr:cytochrome c peroxidase [Hwangdonia sp. SCSIO 19198]WOD43873.1 cytochrome c peroxidase [Hwangdonia sp. SCSIO 19198]